MYVFQGHKYRLLLQIVLEHLGKDAHSIHLGINLDSGLGVFDAFFASLCMILVSEVCFWPLL